MRVDAIVESARRKKLSPLQRKVLQHLQSRDYEVFGYRDEELARDLGLKPSALGFTLWTLHQRGLIGKAKVEGKVYFGSHDAVAHLKDQVGTTRDEDWFEAAIRTRNAIYEKHGSISVMELLDEVRSGRCYALMQVSHLRSCFVTSSSPTKPHPCLPVGGRIRSS